MNILQFHGLPTEYKGYKLSTDFRNMINVEMLMHDTELKPYLRHMLMLQQLYSEVPSDIELAFDGLLWFYTRGDGGNNDNGHSSRKQSFDFDQDADYIYASFASAYNIRLDTIPYMHWWEFLSLFYGLPENTVIKRIMYYRTCDENKLSKHEKAHVLEMRKLFALKNPDNKAIQSMTIEEMNRSTMEYYDKRANGGG